MFQLQDARASLQRDLTTSQKDSSATIERLQLELARYPVKNPGGRLRVNVNFRMGEGGGGPG
jgi:hypothetical protein